jgi:hypothetical protein
MRNVSQLSIAIVATLALLGCGSSDDPAQGEPSGGSGDGPDDDGPGGTSGGAGSSDSSGSASGGTSSSGGGEPVPGCGFAEAAFCDAFEAPSPGGRGGDLDEQRWSVARVNQSSNPSQGSLNTWSPSILEGCGAPVSGVIPPNDYVLCDGGLGSHLAQTFHDGGSFAYHSIRIRQPFDFAERTGTIAFDLAGRVAGGHGWWVEIWVVDQPVPGPYQSAPGTDALPRRGIGLQLSGANDCGGAGASQNRLTTIFLMQDFDIYSESSGGDLEAADCFPVSDDAFNHYEVRLSEGRIELWSTSPGNKDDLTLIGARDLEGLGFTRGYVHFQQTHYNAAKDGHTAHHTFHWDNIGFDGPVLATPRGYDVPDQIELWASDANPDGAVNLGYGLSPDEPTKFTFEGVSLDGATAATLDFNVNQFVVENTMEYRVNGGPWHPIEHPFPGSTGSWRALSVPVDLAELSQGENVIELSGSTAWLNVANVDLTVE